MPPIFWPLLFLNIGSWSAFGPTFWPSLPSPFVEEPADGDQARL